MQVTTIEELQEKVGLFGVDNPLGIIYQSVEYTALYDLLKDYLVTADFHMYYKYGSRILSRKYEHAYIMENYDRIKQAITYALLSQEYKLKTLIDTTLLEYNPIDNYEITETIVTSTTIAANVIKGEQSNLQSVSEIKTTDETSKTFSTGAYSETGNDTRTQGKQSNSGTNNTTFSEQSNSGTSNTTFGEQSNNSNQTTNYGERTETGVSTFTKSPYNDNNYHPREQTNTDNTKDAITDTVATGEILGTHTDKTTTNNTIGQHTENTTTSESIGERKDIISTSKQINAKEDTETDNTTRTQSPHTTTETLGEREDKTDSNENTDRQRNVHGRYGYTTTQSLIEAERNIADISIVEEIIKIVLETICTSVLWIE